MNPTITNDAIVKEIVINAPAERIFASESSGGRRRGDFRRPTWNRISVQAGHG
jgi:hypothetical protein